MDDNTNWTPFPDDNLLGLVNKEIINEREATGITAAELYIFDLDTEVPISSSIILEIHKIAFGELYDWAGKLRTAQVTVGQLIPPSPNKVLQLLYQFVDNLNYKISISETYNDRIECLVFSHYEFVRIHPFNNGNGRTGRLLMNMVAMKFGYKPITLYYQDGESRGIYIQAMKSADIGNYNGLKALIKKELSVL